MDDAVVHGYDVAVDVDVDEVDTGGRMLMIEELSSALHKT